VEDVWAGRKDGLGGGLLSKSVPLVSRKKFIFDSLGVREKDVPGAGGRPLIVEGKEGLGGMEVEGGWKVGS